MKISLENKVAILTGGGGGIGRAAAEKLARLKMHVVLLGGNRQETLAETGKLVKKYSSCTIIPGNLTDFTFLDTAVKEIIDRCGKADVLINNAGVAQNTPFEQISIEEFDRIMAINAKVPFFLTQKLLPYLKKSDHATVINIASVVSHAGYPLQSAYTASKHALLGFTKSLAREYFKDNIRVHAICPGGVYTDMVKISRPDLTSEGMIRPEEIADIIAFFLENRGNAIIDEILVHRSSKEPFSV